VATLVRQMPPEKFPVSATVLDELPRVADAGHFDRGLAALANGRPPNRLAVSGRQYPNTAGRLPTPFAILAGGALVGAASEPA